MYLLNNLLTGFLGAALSIPVAALLMDGGPIPTAEVIFFSALTVGIMHSFVYAYMHLFVTPSKVSVFIAAAVFMLLMTKNWSQPLLVQLQGVTATAALILIGKIALLSVCTWIFARPSKKLLARRSWQQR
jgi:chromate transport protein ChrA